MTKKRNKKYGLVVRAGMFLTLAIGIGCTDSIPSLPYSFDISQEAKVDSSVLAAKNGWVNLAYPELHATIYCSYLRGKQIGQSLQDSYKLVDRQQRIQDVQEKVFENPEKQVYGSLFLLKGDCISPIQFHLTDSTDHFFRGAVYYAFEPKADSIAPVTQYLIQDVMHLMETFNWKE